MNKITASFEKFVSSIYPFKKSAIVDQVKKMNESPAMMPKAIMDPYILEERQLNVAQLDVFSRLMMDRVMVFSDEVNSATAITSVCQLLYLDSIGEEDITMYINSPGGSVIDGLGIVDTMNYIKSDVSTINVANSHSMGSILLGSGAKGKRYSLPSARVMIHQPLGGTQGQASDIEIEAKLILAMKKDLVQRIADFSGQKYEKVYADCDRNYWMTAQEAKAYGIIDDIITKKK